MAVERELKRNGGRRSNDRRSGCYSTSYRISWPRSKQLIDPGLVTGLNIQEPGRVLLPVIAVARSDLFRFRAGAVFY